ncbi:hypothetical protein GGR53DRAFT_515209 [Hypoxylon sp. FL1150]|nr:hypothetical protein GGR53DRAFT_515209 [Hypoxylon sp. FL1150]
MDWEEWWQIIVHRNVRVVEAVPPGYPEDYWTLSPKEPPFPFNLDATWYCAAVLVLLLAMHCELESLWLFRHGYIHYIVRISSKVVLTVALSFASTLAYEVLGNIHELLREGLEFRIVESWFVQSSMDRAHFRNEVRETVSSNIALLTQNVILLISSLLGYAGPAVSIWVLGRISTGLASFLANLTTLLALPTPGTDELSGLSILLWEFGVPAYFQVCVAALSYLFVFLFMARAERPLILSRGYLDPFWKLAFELLRSTAMHLLAYTAYQLVCVCVVATKNYLLRGHAYEPILDNPLVLKSNTEIAPGAGILILGLHWLVKRICKLWVLLAWPLWVPFMVWLSIKTKDSTRDNWIVYGALLDEDMDVLNPDKRVIARATMTALFGLKSSWPARMRLSNVAGVD